VDLSVTEKGKQEKLVMQIERDSVKNFKSDFIISENLKKKHRNKSTRPCKSRPVLKAEF